MKKFRTLSFTFLIIFSTVITIVSSTGCANIIPPTGGPKDSLPPVLIYANPGDSTVRFKGNTIRLTFNEFVEVQNAFENVIVSPTPTSVPNINYHLREVSIKLKDTLEPSTTYSINFGNSIKDVNEGNIYKDFTYVFSTGNELDQNTLAGKVILAETGTVDSTLIVVLHRNLDDSAVVKEKPRYITKLDGKGNFEFRNLAAGTFALYAIPNEFSKRYDDTTKPFAFADKPVNTTQDSAVTLYAYRLPRRDTTPAKPAAPPAAGKKQDKDDKKVKLVSNIEGGRQDIFKDLEINISRPATTYDSTKIRLTDKNFSPVAAYSIIPDTTNTRFVIKNKWNTGTEYYLVVDKEAFADSTGAMLAKNDTLRFTTKTNEDYGSVRLRFNNLDFTTNPVLQIIQSEKIVESVVLTQAIWDRKLFLPGDYELRILFDTNKNGVWDPGRFFGEHLQPERVITLSAKLTVRPNWDNELTL